jgi:RNA polymerase sigma-54 factor
VDSLPAPEDERALLKLDLAASADGQEEASPAAFLEWVGADGRLAAPLEEVARNLGATQAEAEMAIRRVRDLAPPGFAAQDLRECLCLQAEALALSGGEEAATARQILTRHWQSFVRGHYRKIARSLGVDGKQVARAADFIRSRFAAYPGGVASASPAVEPDVSVAVCDGQLKIEVLGPVPEQLCISPPWEQAARNPRLEQRQRASVRSLLDRAALFIQGIGFRARTLGALTAALAEAEKPFFAAALAHPVPLKREEVARRAGLHPSTARRALSQKNLLLPDGRTVPFEIFFDASLPAKRELRRILLAETSSRRLSDSALAEVLRGQGLTVARRTVAKYRREMGLDSHHRTGQDERG